MEIRGYPAYQSLISSNKKTQLNIRQLFRISRRGYITMSLLLLLLFFGYLGWPTITATNQNSYTESTITATTEARQTEDFKNNILRLPNSMNYKVNETLTVCSELLTDSRVYIQNLPREKYDNQPMIYFVTPTYPRREQIAELTRVAHTLMHVPKVFWILANDHPTCNSYLDLFCHKLGLPYTHLSSPMPDNFRKQKTKPRGVANRRAALKYLLQRNITHGVLYFGDDDNTYSLNLFSEIRETQIVSMFPVGLIENLGVSGPVVRKGKVVGFLDTWVADRRWPVDMAGFAVNLGYMAEHPKANMPYKPGYEEDYFLRSISLKQDQIEPKGTNCTEILVWHTQSKNHNRTTVRIDSEYLDDRSNLGALLHSLERMGVIWTSNTNGEKAIISRNGKAKPINYFLS